MKIHEFQAKEILKRYGVEVPRGELVRTPAEAGAAVERLGGRGILKAQVHAGGRGKGGGIKLAGSAAQAEKLAGALLGTRLVTPQSGPEGKPIESLLVEEALEPKHELYLGATLDRATAAPVLIACAEGGVEIEEVAARNPALILREAVEPLIGWRPFQARKLAQGLGVPREQVKALIRTISGLYAAFWENDASLVEINPLAITADGRVLALDAKINLDDNALYRQPKILEQRDISQEEPLEVEASRAGLSYIKLDGTVACMVNGAGLAMATLDLILHAGGRPANFLDVGGGASAEQVTRAFRILVSDERARSVLINIFGGIMRCDVLARGVVEAAREVKVDLPVVVRLEGTNAEEGRRILSDSGLSWSVAAGFDEAARTAVKMAKER
ncbi:MAG: ADP-forming succinate--CoA ligase subunit beta [Acidobacteriota bacterium]